MNNDIKKILILDDDKMVRESLVDFFEDKDWNVIQAGTGEEALELVQKEKPHAATVDIRLPGIDGNEFVRRISKVNSTLACVICTGSPEFELPDDIEALVQVHSEVFIKPITNLDNLESALHP